MSQIPVTNCQTLIELYDVLLFDAYGVLVNHLEVLPHAVKLIDHLNHIKKDYLIVTNNASEPSRSIAKKFKERGLKIPEKKILSSGSLIKPWIQEQNLNTCRCLFMGSSLSQKLFKGTQCEITKVADLDPDKNQEFDLLVLCTQEEKNYRANIEKLMTYLFHAKEQNTLPKLLLPNPDLIYPKDTRNFGIVSGMIALVLESALKIRFPTSEIKFCPLGKPSSYIFKQAKEMFANKKLVMIGDQIETDIKGASLADLDSVLMTGGVVSEKNLSPIQKYLPTYLLKDLRI